MNIMTNEIGASANTALEMLAIALQEEIASGKNKRAIDFKEAYPLIEQHLANNGSQKTACDKFNAVYGYKLHQPQFRKMLNAERMSREASGDGVRCIHCNTPLHSATVGTEPDYNTEAE
ncbi:MAG: hypothetical protein DI597_07425 [Pseudoxanthomonas spadix]|nr:MAG: hypothetical protein DI597_07425 [Pseudoxanthomonas spadix]